MRMRGSRFRFQRGEILDEPRSFADRRGILSRTIPGLDPRQITPARAGAGRHENVVMAGLHALARLTHHERPRRFRRIAPDAEMP
jgi:hypothetical protein